MKSIKMDILYKNDLNRGQHRDLLNRAGACDAGVSKGGEFEFQLL